ncbi:cytochrome C' [Salipaludibacillus keqinensis]|uniref:Cytochrome C n=1 Tax=Salipaludibacillus keqinensis TaxID=2045207 RepID=A0A323T9F0_9BACI|nr:cytochrome c [Salipaludibacillus keqinensis]PYZ91736.1 cytochrome C' [Salipaludibacillus keqinensis]
MKKILIAILLGTSLVLAACGGNSENEPVNSQASSNGSIDLANGEEIYQQKCSGCHGGDLTGAGASGVRNLTYEEVLDAVVNGAGSMPAGLATGSDAEDVSAWVEKIGNE